MISKTDSPLDAPDGGISSDGSFQNWHDVTCNDLAQRSSSEAAAKQRCFAAAKQRCFLESQAADANEVKDVPILPEVIAVQGLLGSCGEKVLHDSAYGDLLRKTNRKFCLVFPTPGFGLPIKHVWRGQWRNPQHVPLILQLWVLFTELHKALDVEDHDEENVARVSETQFFIKTAEGEPVWQDRFSVIFFRKKKKCLKFQNSWNSRTFPVGSSWNFPHPQLSGHPRRRWAVRLKNVSKDPPGSRGCHTWRKKNTGMCIEKNDYMI